MPSPAPAEPRHEPYMEVLSRQECLDLLRTAPFVRLAFSTAGEVHVLPVNAFVLDDEVVVRTSYGSKLAAATRHAMMTVQADDIDRRTRTGWALQVMGPARLVEDPDELAVLDIVDSESWAPGEKEYYVGVSIEHVTGRRLARTVRK